MYSTCTFAPEENEKIISEIINEQKVKVQKSKINGLKASSGITKWNGETYDKEVENCMRIWPHHNDTDAFFVARLEKC